MSKQSEPTFRSKFGVYPEVMWTTGAVRLVTTHGLPVYLEFQKYASVEALREAVHAAVAEAQAGARAVQVTAVVCSDHVRLGGGGARLEDFPTGEVRSGSGVPHMIFDPPTSDTAFSAAFRVDVAPTALYFMETAIR